MDINENIKAREELKEKSRKGQKLLIEERAWLLENPVYNEKDKLLKRDILLLPAGKKTILRITIESVCFSGKSICPAVGSVDPKGRIQTDCILLGRDGAPTGHTSARGLTIGADSSPAEFDFQSKNGLLSVNYECDYYDTLTKRHTGGSSAGASNAYGMKKEVLSETKVRYNCRSPIDQTFGALVFTVEWL